MWVFFHLRWTRVGAVVRASLVCSFFSVVAAGLLTAVLRIISVVAFTIRFLLLLLLSFVVSIYATGNGSCHSDVLFSLLRGSIDFFPITGMRIFVFPVTLINVVSIQEFLVIEVIRVDESFLGNSFVITLHRSGARISFFSHSITCCSLRLDDHRRALLDSLSHWGRVDYMRGMNVGRFISFFFFFSSIGWEVNLDGRYDWRNTVGLVVEGRRQHLSRVFDLRLFDWTVVIAILHLTIAVLLRLSHILDVLRDVSNTIIGYTELREKLFYLLWHVNRLVKSSLSISRLRNEWWIVTHVLWKSWVDTWLLHPLDFRRCFSVGVNHTISLCTRETIRAILLCMRTIVGRNQHLSLFSWAHLFPNWDFQIYVVWV